MFKIVENRTFTHPVPIKYPVDGGYQTEKVNVTYNVLEDEEMEKHPLNTSDGIKGFCVAAIVTIEGFGDEQGNPREWNDALRDAVLKDYWIRQALLDGYLNAVQKGKLGN